MALELKLAGWLDRTDTSVRQLARDCEISYRTAWLASQGFRVNYKTAKLISKYTSAAVSIDSLCSGRSRYDITPVGV